MVRGPQEQGRMPLAKERSGRTCPTRGPSHTTASAKLAELVAKAQSEAVDITAKRVATSLDEVAGAAKVVVVGATFFFSSRRRHTRSAFLHRITGEAMKTAEAYEHEQGWDFEKAAMP